MQRGQPPLQTCTDCGGTRRAFTFPALYVENDTRSTQTGRANGSRQQQGGAGGTHERKGKWTGFANVAQTVVERLLREGGDADPDAADAPLATQLATLQHIISGHCVQDVEYRAATRTLCAATTAICKQVRRVGGGSPDLWDTVTRADAYVRAGSPSDTLGWEALRDMLACNVPNPRWAVPGGLTTQQQREHTALINASIVEVWGDLLRAAENVRIAWRNMTRHTVLDRERLEAGRGMLRLIIRSWREVTDGVRAGAARWAQRWAASDIGNPLARRLCFNYTTSYYGTEAGWRVRAVLTWLRIVRAEKVRRQRRRSDTWRATEQSRLQQIYERGRLPALTTQTPQIYEWGAQEQVSATAGTSSGAAAVIHKRSRSTITATRDTSTVQRPRRQLVTAAHSPEPTHERRTDGQLTFTTNAHRLYVARITRWRWWPRTGDG